MKKLLVLLTVIMAVSIFPLAAYANEGHYHDQDWQAHHDHVWRHHEREWREHDREWKEHRYDRHWREVHAKKWHDWYQWHKDYADHFHLGISGDNFELDIDN